MPGPRCLYLAVLLRLGGADAHVHGGVSRAEMAGYRVHCWTQVPCLWLLCSSFLVVSSCCPSSLSPCQTFCLLSRLGFLEENSHQVITDSLTESRDMSVVSLREAFGLLCWLGVGEVPEEGPSVSHVQSKCPSPVPWGRDVTLLFLHVHLLRGRSHITVCTSTGRSGRSVAVLKVQIWVLRFPISRSIFLQPFVS